MIGLESRVSRSDRVAARVVQGRAVIVVMDTRALHTLNEVGTKVWESLGREQRRSVAELVDEVVAEFDVEPARAAEDVLGFVDAMIDVGALMLEEGPG